jgi:RNA recognition motif-containing protein
VNFGHYAAPEPSRKSFTSNQLPSKTIMIRNLLFEMTDEELTVELNMLMVPYKHIRLVKSRDTGMNRGFAFIEFNTVEEAQRWMTLTQVGKICYLEMFLVVVICRLFSNKLILFEQIKLQRTPGLAVVSEFRHSHSAFLQSFGRAGFAKRAGKRERMGLCQSK